MAPGPATVNADCGSYGGGAERQIEPTTSAAEVRLTAELNAPHAERQWLITEAARVKAAKKSSDRW